MAVQVWTVQEFLDKAREYAAKEFSELAGEDRVNWLNAVKDLGERAHTRGDGVAVYTNEDLGHPEIGQWQVVSYGTPASQLETRPPHDSGERLNLFVHGDDALPVSLPDIGGRINWRYQLHAVVPSYQQAEQAFNDPTVSCCGRDAADCDCRPTEGHLVLVQVRVSPQASAEDALTLVRAAVENGIDIWTTSGGEAGFTQDDAHIGQTALEASVNLDLIDVEIVG